MRLHSKALAVTASVISLGAGGGVAWACTGPGMGAPTTTGTTTAATTTGTTTGTTSTGTTSTGTTAASTTAATDARRLAQSRHTARHSRRSAQRR